MSFLNCCRANEIKNDFIINNEKTDNSKKEISNSIISFDNKSIKKKETINTQKISSPIINTTNQNNITLNENQNNINFTQISFGNIDFSTANNTISSGKLLLTGNLFFNKELIITQNGLVNSLRKRIDGQTFFGTSNAKDYTGTYYNDFILNLPEEDNKNQEILSHTFWYFF